jgi:DNA (cytosine-5)-methyltransferase 1
MTFADLCSGISAPAVAAQWLKWEYKFYCEINDFCLQILKYWYPYAEKYTDIRKSDFRKWRGKIDVLCAGFPCQPFSVAGSRKGAGDDRYLWEEVKRVIKEVGPGWFVGENVAGITSMVLPGNEIKVGRETDLFGTESVVYERTETKY